MMRIDQRIVITGGCQSKLNFTETVDSAKWLRVHLEGINLKQLKYQHDFEITGGDLSVLNTNLEQCIDEIIHMSDWEKDRRHKNVWPTVWRGQSYHVPLAESPGSEFIRLRNLYEITVYGIEHAQSAFFFMKPELDEFASSIIKKIKSEGTFIFSKGDREQKEGSRIENEQLDETLTKLEQFNILQQEGQIYSLTLKGKLIY